MARWRALKVFLPGSSSWILYRTCNLATNLCLVQTIVNLELTAHLFSHFTTGSVANDSIKKVGQRSPPMCLWLPLSHLNPRDSVYPARSVFFSRHQTIEIGSTHRNEQWETMDRIMKYIEFWELLGFAAQPGKGRDLSCWWSVSLTKSIEHFSLPKINWTKVLLNIVLLPLSQLPNLLTEHLVNLTLQYRTFMFLTNYQLNIDLTELLTIDLSTIELWNNECWNSSQ